MKFLTSAAVAAAVVICALSSGVDTQSYGESVLDYFDFVDIQKDPYVSSREARARSFDTQASESVRSNTETYISAPAYNIPRYAPHDTPSRRSFENAGVFNRRLRPTAPIQPLGSLAKVYSRPINQKPITQKRYNQNFNADYNPASSSFNQPRRSHQQVKRPQQVNQPQLLNRPQPVNRPQRINRPEFEPSQQYFPEHTRPKPQYKKRPQYNQEHQYNPNTEYGPNSQYRPQIQHNQEHQYNPNAEYGPNTQYRPQIQHRPKPQFKPEPQFSPNFVAQIEEPIYQDSNDYQDSFDYLDSINSQDLDDYQKRPITYKETPIIKTKEFTFDDQPSEIQNNSPQYIDESLPNVNEEPQYEDEYPNYEDFVQVFKDYEQELKQTPVEVAETNRGQSQATINALPVLDKQAQESSVIEKRQAGVHSDLDSAGQAFVADAAEVEHAKDAGRLAFQIHGQQGPHSYRFGYDTGKGYNRQFRYEERDGNGEVHGRYGHYDDDGKLRVVNYSAHPKHGFKADVPYDR